MNIEKTFYDVIYYCGHGLLFTYINLLGVVMRQGEEVEDKKYMLKQFLVFSLIFIIVVAIDILDSSNNWREFVSEFIKWFLYIIIPFTIGFFNLFGVKKT